MLTHFRIIIALATTLAGLCISLDASAQAQASRPRAPADRPQGVSASLSAVDAAMFYVKTDTVAGSGFQYRTPGYVLTNRHVVEDVPIGGKVELRGVRVGALGVVGLGDPISGTVQFKHPQLDVAVVRIPIATSRKCLQPAAILEHGHATKGTALWAHGFPGMTGTVDSLTSTPGSLSGHRLDAYSGQLWYITDADIDHGSSGGPVTDSTGAVIGIASQVSLVDDGAGNSFGYILPIRLVDEALATAGGWRTLPKPFSADSLVGRWRNVATMEAVADGYYEGVRKAIAETGSPAELAQALGVLRAGIASWNGPRRPEDDAKAFSKIFAAEREVIARVIEFMFQRGESNDVMALAEVVVDYQWIQEWAAQPVQGGGQQDAVVAAFYATFIGGFADLGDEALERAALSCAGLAAPDGAAPSREQYRATANGIADLVVGWQATVTMGGMDPGSWDPDDPNRPLDRKSRQLMRTAKATMQNCLDKWADLPSECRQLAADWGQWLGGLESVKPEQVAVWLQEAGWSALLRSAPASANGEVVTRDISIGAAPAIVHLYVSESKSRQASGTAMEVRVSGPDGREISCWREAADRRSATWSFEAASAGAYSVECRLPQAASVELELSAWSRPSKMNELRKSLRDDLRTLPGSWESGSFPLTLDPGEQYTVPVPIDDAAATAGFACQAASMRGEPLLLTIISPQGVVLDESPVASGVAKVAAPTDTSGNYIVTVKNQGTAVASVDYVGFRVPRRPG